MTMEMFLEELCTAVENVAVKNNFNVDSARVDNDQLIVNIRTDRGVCNCINIHQYIIWPCKTHQMMIEEIFIGYDEEGSPWSDHMGGRIVDCTGFKFKGAIDKIVEKFIEKATT